MDEKIPRLSLKRGLLLISGGFDSAVAGWMMRERGLSIEAVHFSQQPFTDSSPEEKSRALCGKLGFSPFTVVNLGKQFAAFADICQHRYFFVLSKRLMMRVACSLAASRGCDCLVTGESLGQVSSQTLTNLAAIDGASSLPVLRPLLGMDKNEILARCHALGTFEISKGPELCGVLGPKNPATAVSLERVLREELRVDIAGMVGAALGEAPRTAAENPSGASAPQSAQCPGSRCASRR